MDGSSVAARRTQHLRGVLDLCVLALIAQKEQHAYAIVQALRERGLADVAEGTVYPLLARLQRLGLVTAKAAASRQGPPRKVYLVTALGADALAVWRGAWRETTDAVSRCVEPSGIGAADKNGAPA